MANWIQDGDGRKQVIRHDGGRKAAGFKGKAGDCATRAIAIATGHEYRQVYDRLNAIIKAAPLSRRIWKKTRINPEYR